MADSHGMEAKLPEDELSADAAGVTAEMDAELASLAAWRAQRAVAAAAAAADANRHEHAAAAEMRAVDDAAGAEQKADGVTRTVYHSSDASHRMILSSLMAGPRHVHSDVVESKLADQRMPTAEELERGTLRMHAQLLAKQRLAELGLTDAEIEDATRGGGMQ